MADGVRDLHSISEEIELFHQRDIHIELINNTWWLLAATLPCLCRGHIWGPRAVQTGRSGRGQSSSHCFLPWLAGRNNPGKPHQ